MSDGTRCRAVVAGLLPAPQATALLLAGPADAQPSDEQARAQLPAIKQMLVDSAAQREVKTEAAHEQRIHAERAEKAALQERIENYRNGQNAGSREGRNASAALFAALLNCLKMSAVTECCTG
jgi:hypothetical protein